MQSVGLTLWDICILHSGIFYVRRERRIYTAKDDTPWTTYSTMWKTLELVPIYAVKLTVEEHFS